MFDPMLTSAAAAQLIGMARSTLEKLRVTGTGPAFHKIGRLVRYRREDLEAWVKARRTLSTSEAVVFGQHQSNRKAKS